MDKNFELIDQVLGIIERHPGRWDQTLWGVRRREKERKQLEAQKGQHVCETAFCFAGHAAIIARPDIPFVKRNKWRHVTSVDDIAIDPRTEEYTSMQRVAQQELGLNNTEAYELFEPDNSLHKIKRIIGRWKKEAGIR